MNKPTLIDLPGAIHRISSARQIVLTTHSRADGDAIGSVAAMRRIARQNGKDVVALLHEIVPERYAFLTAGEPLGVWSSDTASSILSRADLLLILDTCSANQLAPLDAMIRASSLAKLAIDHHITRDDIVDEAWVDDRAAACAQIITRLCDEAAWRIDEKTAELLFAGLATDTGWFRFSNADATVFSVAARLIAAGARPNELYERLFLNEITPRARLIGAVMSGFELHANGRLAVARLTRDVIARSGATHQMTEDLINEPQRVGSVMACILCVEPPDDGPIRVSFRSKRDIDVAAIAARFGGGGHARAAGAKINGAIDDVARQVTQAMLAAMPRD